LAEGCVVAAALPGATLTAAAAIVELDGCGAGGSGITLDLLEAGTTSGWDGKGLFWLDMMVTEDLLFANGGQPIQ